MRVCVVGLWHQGTVTAACLAAIGHEVVGLDFDVERIAALRAGRSPVLEPGLDALIASGAAEGQLRFTTDAGQAVAGAAVVWVAYDTPVDDKDRADVEFVVERATRLFPHLEAAPIVLVSSQVPVGTTRRLEEMYRQAYPGGQARFAYSPENLRLGKAVDVFQHPDRIVVGVRSADDRQDLARLFHPWTDRIAWMGVESAEMAKHALNAFLATSVTFANEVASLCEHVGADAKDVERALKSDIRIGHKAYVAPGSAFAGGTLARDVVFLGDLGRRVGQPTPVLSGVRESNEHHKRWVHRHLEAEGALRRRRIGVWGLTYKPGTDTLRRSLSVELCLWLSEQGAVVRAHDPAVRTLPAELAGVFELASDPLAAAAAADVLVVSTEWPEYRQVLSADVIAVMRAPFVLDPNRFLAGTLGSDPRVRYRSVGQAAS